MEKLEHMILKATTYLSHTWLGNMWTFPTSYEGDLMYVGLSHTNNGDVSQTKSHLLHYIR